MPHVSAAFRAIPMVPLVLAAIVILSASAHASALEALFAPKAKLWDRWTAHDPASTETIDHSDWDRFLAAYLVPDRSGVNRVAYGRVTQADRQALDAYIDRLAALPISTYSRPEQYAYWFNLYNALTVQVILDHYPVASIRDIDISPGLFADGPWRKSLLRIEGERVSLDDIEHRILRPIWQDPRIHYGVNCAAVGCPDLQPSAFTADNVDAMLDAAARDYVNDPRGWYMKGDRIVVSSIYIWFKPDFGSSDADVIEHLKQYSTPERAAELANVKGIADSDYDWSLNDDASSS